MVGPGTLIVNNAKKREKSENRKTTIDLGSLRYVGLRMPLLTNVQHGIVSARR